MDLKAKEKLISALSGKAFPYKIHCCIFYKGL